MRPCFTPTSGRTFYKNLQHKIVVQKDAFVFVIKLERGGVLHCIAIPAAGKQDADGRILGEGDDLAAGWGGGGFFEG